MLIPADPSDTRDAWETGFNSDVTASMARPPLYPEKPPCTFEEFIDDWKPHYFSGSRPLLGRIWKIMTNGERAGYITYNDINETTHRVEMDIWLASAKCCGKGYGSDALIALCDYVAGTFGIKEVFIQPSLRNPRAIRAYEKAGFVKVGCSTEEAEKRFNSVRDCFDSQYMVKQMGHPASSSLSNTLTARLFKVSDIISGD